MSAMFVTDTRAKAPISHKTLLPMQEGSLQYMATPLLCELLLQSGTSLEVAATFRPILANLVVGSLDSLAAGDRAAKQDLASAVICLIDLMEFAPYLSR